MKPRKKTDKKGVGYRNYGGTHKNMDTTTLILAMAPIILIDLALLVFAMYDLIKRDRQTVRGGNKIIWALVILFLSTIGPVLYLVFGRVEGREGLNG